MHTKNDELGEASIMQYDFTQTINTTQLLDEISTAGLPAPDTVNTDDTNVHIVYTNALSGDQLTTLTTVVSSHVANAAYIPLATQNETAKLTAYLNSANVVVANTARAVMVANLAPRLPLSLMQTINNQIKNLVGF